jgi:RNA polymerase-associated protein RTF1
MSESDSDASRPPDGDEGPIFPYEKIFLSAKDKAEVMAMPDLQREELLSERAQQVDRHYQTIALRLLLASREGEEARAADKRKRKAGAADLEESKRKSSRQKTTLGGRKVGEASGAMEAYKRQREEKGKRDELRRRDTNSKKKDRTSGSPDGAISDREANGQSDNVEWDDGKHRRSVSAPKDDPPADLRDIQRARIGRSNFAQVCFYPGFEQAITNCYTRVVIGVNKETGQNEYRLCLIKSEIALSADVCLLLTGPLPSRVYRGQALCHGRAEWEEFCHYPVRHPCAWQSGEGISIYCMLRFPVY